MNEPTPLRGPGEGDVVWGSVERFKNRETDGVFEQLIAKIYKAGGELDTSTKPQVEVQLPLLSPLRIDEEGNIDYEAANNIAQDALLKLQEHFRRPLKRNTVQDPEDPEKQYWIAYYYDRGKEIQIFFIENHPPLIIEKQKEEYGFFGKAILSIAGSSGAKELRERVYKIEKAAKRAAAKKRHPVFGTRGKN